MPKRAAPARRTAPKGSAWDDAYRSTPPWDTNHVDPQLSAYLAAKLPPGRRVLEVGCGTGTNSVFLAKRGSLVTAVDLSPRAISAAKRRADQAHTAVDFQVADATTLRLGKRFDWAFDRGCYHSLPKAAAPKYRAALLRHLDRGSHLLLLCFSDKEPAWKKPPSSTPSHLAAGPRRLSKADLISEFGADFVIRSIADFRWETSVPGFSPHGYAALLVKK